MKTWQKLAVCIVIVTLFSVVIELATFSTFACSVWCMLLAVIYGIILNTFIVKQSRHHVASKVQKETIKGLGAICQKYNEHCEACPVRLDGCYRCQDAMYRYPSLVAEEVNDWVHKNRQEWFLSRFPNATLAYDGVLSVCPRRVYGDDARQPDYCAFNDCDVCRKQFWTSAIKEETLD